MEQNDASRRQFGPPTYPAQQQQQLPRQPSQQHQHPQQRQDQQTLAVSSPSQFATSAPSDRFRQPAYPQHSPAAGHVGARPATDAQQLYAFPQAMQYGAAPSIPANPLQYGQQYQAQDAPQAQSQTYSQYGPNVVYGMQQAPNAQPEQPSYEQVQQFRPRSSAATDSVPPHFGEPHSGQYYMAGPRAGQSSDFTGQPMASQYHPDTYAQSGQAASQSFSSSMIDPSQSASHQSYSQQASFASSAESHADPQGQTSGHYQQMIRTIFAHVRDGSLHALPQQLLEISHYLIGSAESLGLTRDEEGQRDRHVRLWDEFNNAWLTTLQRQLDLCQDMLSGQTLRNPQSLISQRSLEHLARELVRLCDGVEKHGLVDYQIGVAEDEIIDLILRCLSVMDSSGQSTSEPGESTTAGASRRR